VQQINSAPRSLSIGSLAVDQTWGYQITPPYGICCSDEDPSWDPDNFDLLLTETGQASLDAVNSCNGTVFDLSPSIFTWASDNTSVAIVTEQHVEAVGVGTTTGTATGDISVGVGGYCPLRTVQLNTHITVNAPTITGISPGSGTSGTNVAVTISGTNFGPNAAALSISGVPGTVSTVNSAGTQITATFNLTTLSAGSYSIVVNVSNGDGGGGSSNPWTFVVNPVQVNTAEITVIGWLNASVITLPSGENSGLQTDLSNALSCHALVLAWAAGFTTDINGQADINYANAFLLQNSGNAAPPSTIVPITQFNGGNFRLFNDLQVSFFESDGVISSSNSIKSIAAVGSTPDPCRYLGTAGGQNHPDNGYQGITSSATGVYQLAEGRIGTLGQEVSTTLNGRTVPWIWNVIEFNASGVPNAANNSIFPTFSVYQNGSLIATYPQSSITSFIALDDTYQLLPSQIQ
jgi:hypothetical protein